MPIFKQKGVIFTFVNVNEDQGLYVYVLVYCYDDFVPQNFFDTKL